MAKVTKPLKTIEVTTGCDKTYTVADTAEKYIASNALEQFRGGKTMALETGENEITYVPFHAVCAVKVTKSTTEVDKADPYGCETEETPEP